MNDEPNLARKALAINIPQVRKREELNPKNSWVSRKQQQQIREQIFKRKTHNTINGKRTHVLTKIKNNNFTLTATVETAKNQ